MSCKINDLVAFLGIISTVPLLRNFVRNIYS